MNTTQDATLDRRNDVVWPVVAIVLAVLPFWVFGGSSSSTTVNGEVVSEQSVNLLGVVLAVAAIVIGVKRVRGEGGNVAVRRTLSVVAIVIGVVQLPLCVGLL